MVILKRHFLASKRSDGAVTRFAIATETFVKQDGWVLKASGFRLWTDILPIRWDHGFKSAVPFNLGVWSNIAAVDGEILAEPDWASEDVPGVKAVRALAEAGMVNTSVSFRVEKQHAPTAEERAIYAIPEDDGFARIADTWTAFEASFTDVPADANSGPRGLAGGLEKQLISAADRSLLDPGSQLGEVLEILRESTRRDEQLESQMRELRDSFERISQRFERIAEQLASARGSADPRVTQSDHAMGRGLYDLKALGMDASALRKRLEEKTGTTHDDRDGDEAHDQGDGPGK